jgi:hypothetical protein
MTVEEAGCPFGHLITGPPAKYIAQRRLPRAVRPHNRMNFARVDGQRQTFEDRLAIDFGVEVRDLEHII